MEFNDLRIWAEFIRDIALIIGVPALGTLTIRAINTHIEVLRERIELLKQTQYTNALSELKAQRELYEQEKIRLNSEKTELSRKVDELKISRDIDQKIFKLDELISGLDNVIQIIARTEGDVFIEHCIAHLELAKKEPGSVPLNLGFSTLKTDAAAMLIKFGALHKLEGSKRRDLYKITTLGEHLLENLKSQVSVN
ncbi:MAG: hypothetical protein P9C55_07405 [Defluviicoccus sp.]|nr:hypothetical protein [Defluviicoccus sp.]